MPETSASRPASTILLLRDGVKEIEVFMKSRKTFARVSVGFVNVNADQAKCSLVAARRT